MPSPSDSVAFPSLRPDLDGAPECCALCRYWQTEAQQLTGPKSPNAAPCRRFPPQMVLGPNPRPLPGQPPVAPAMLPPPMTPATHWCGEYKAPAP